MSVLPPNTGSTTTSTSTGAVPSDASPTGGAVAGLSAVDAKADTAGRRSLAGLGASAVEDGSGWLEYELIPINDVGSDQTVAARTSGVASTTLSTRSSTIDVRPDDIMSDAGTRNSMASSDSGDAVDSIHRVLKVKRDTEGTGDGSSGRANTGDDLGEIPSPLPKTNLASREYQALPVAAGRVAPGLMSTDRGLETTDTAIITAGERPEVVTGSRAYTPSQALEAIRLVISTGAANNLSSQEILRSVIAKASECGFQADINLNFNEKVETFTMPNVPGEYYKVNVRYAITLSQGEKQVGTSFERPIFTSIEAKAGNLGHQTALLVANEFAKTVVGLAKGVNSDFIDTNGVPAPQVDQMMKQSSFSFNFDYDPQGIPKTLLAIRTVSSNQSTPPVGLKLRNRAPAANEAWHYNDFGDLVRIDKTAPYAVTIGRALYASEREALLSKSLRVIHTGRYDALGDDYSDQIQAIQTRIAASISSSNEITSGAKAAPNPATAAAEDAVRLRKLTIDLENDLNLLKQIRDAAAHRAEASGDYDKQKAKAIQTLVNGLITQLNIDQVIAANNEFLKPS